MGVYRIRSGSVGRPFTKGNPGGGRPKGAQNKATLEIKEFARNFLMSDRYQRTLERTLERRILAGTAPHMEVLLNHYAFGKPTHKYVAPAPAAPPEDELMSRMTIEEQREMYELLTQIREITQAAAARSAAPPASHLRPHLGRGPRVRHRGDCHRQSAVANAGPLEHHRWHRRRTRGRGAGLSRLPRPGGPGRAHRHLAHGPQPGRSRAVRGQRPSSGSASTRTRPGRWCCPFLQSIDDASSTATLTRPSIRPRWSCCSSTSAHGP
jgi:hypothetical protein